MPRSEPEKRRALLRWVMLAILAWGGTLTLGAFLFGYDHQTQEITLAPNPLRGLVVLSCVGIFLGGWLLLLRMRPRNLK